MTISDPKASIDFRCGPNEPWITIGRNQRSQLAWFWWQRGRRWGDWSHMYNAVPTPAISPRFGDLRRKLGMPFEEREVLKADGQGFIKQYRPESCVEFRFTPCKAKRGDN